ARAVTAGVAKHTPIISSVALSEQTGATIVLKAESLQRTGAFKIRGAMNKLAALGAAAARGVTAGSAGNHAQALAFAARHFGVPCDIFVPEGAAISKIEACRSYGATVVESGASLDEAMATARQWAADHDVAFCHPFDDPAVIAGQGTLGLELIEDVADLTLVVVPLGGGGLAAGTAIAVKSQRPDVRVVGVQAELCAPFAGAATTRGPVLTLADGIAVKRPGELTRPLVERWLDDVVVVGEDAIADAMVLLMDRAKLYVEGAGAVGVAALRSGVVAPATEGTTCVVLSGGNVDLGVVPGLIRRHETQAGRRLVVFARIDDRPGGLVRLLSVFAAAGANLIEVEHHREGLDLHVRQTAVHATFEVRSAEHAQEAVAAAQAAGYADLVVEGGHVSRLPTGR
ncbi:MAG: pyridoxal-phosphate dependent enzyme, partial [Acidimicrobiia bacterium]|nr:pyridoxal-phosphate dependent enzyme [Acidimicrobiia bacterium]